jgi:hypothetical protein
MTIFTLLYWKYIIHFILLNWKYVHNVFTILLPNFQSLFKVSCAPYWYWYEKSFSLWHSGSPSLEGQSDGPLSPSDIHPSVIKSEAAYVIRRLTSRCLERKQPSRVGGSPLRDVVSSFLCLSHTHIQTEKISSWNGPTFHVCCFMLARASTKTFVSRVRKTAGKSSLAEKFVSRITR